MESTSTREYHVHLGLGAAQVAVVYTNKAKAKRSFWRSMKDGHYVTGSTWRVWDGGRERLDRTGGIPHWAA
jgi:hypothetical protein